MFTHPTLLFHSESQHLLSPLNLKNQNIQSKPIKSITTRVPNITQLMHQKITTQQFTKILLTYIFHTNRHLPQYQFTQKHS
ncbi:lipoyl protein ligase domain-containing protein, partial [Bacillus pumilus]|uniref:lipoyl protein ligase domain-containing protein n=1 Tax=Bacillus pumilus TaxID=1408 RepID=UPI003F689C4D